MPCHFDIPSRCIPCALTTLCHARPAWPALWSQICQPALPHLVSRCSKTQLQVQIHSVQGKPSSLLLSSALTLYALWAKSTAEVMLCGRYTSDSPEKVSSVQPASTAALFCRKYEAALQG